MQDSYFSGLVYSLANEDSFIEHALMPADVKSALCVAGSGARVLPILARNPEQLTIVDLSQEQLFLTELRIAAVKSFQRDEYIFFMGYRLPTERTLGFSRVELFQRLSLSQSCRDYWEAGISNWQHNGFLYLGRWEQHFQKVAWFLRSVMHIRLENIFAAKDLQEQRLLMKQHFPHLRWGLFIRIVASRFVFNHLLYRGRFSGSQKDGLVNQAPWKFIDHQFKNLFHNHLLRENFFLQTLLLGSIRYEEGFPAEADTKLFLAAKQARTKIDYVKASLVEVLERRSFQFCSLSDTLSYLSAQDIEKLKESRQFTQVDNTRCQKTIFRSFLRVPPGAESLPWTRDLNEEQQAELQDRSGVYRFFIFKT